MSPHRESNPQLPDTASFFPFLLRVTFRVEFRKKLFEVHRDLTCRSFMPNIATLYLKAAALGHTHTHTHTHTNSSFYYIDFCIVAGQSIYPMNIIDKRHE